MSEIKPTRRALLVGLASMTVAAPLVGGWWWATRVRHGDTSDLVLAILRHHLHWMKVTEGAFETFASEYRFNGHRNMLAWAGLAAPVIQRIDIGPVASWATDRFDILEATIVGDFLMSTDFFFPGNEHDEARTHRFLGTWDEYLRPGANPLANRTLVPCPPPASDASAPAPDVTTTNDPEPVDAGTP